SGTSGISGPTRRTCRRTSCAGAPPPWTRPARRSYAPERLRVDDDAPLHLALQHDVERVVQLGEGQAAADHLIEAVLAAHVEIDQHRHVRALVAAAERTAGEHALLQEQRRIDGEAAFGGGR